MADSESPRGGHARHRAHPGARAGYTWRQRMVWYPPGRGTRSHVCVLWRPVVLLRGLSVRRPFGVRGVLGEPRSEHTTPCDSTTG